MFENFFGNQAAVAALESMMASGRIPQTLLFDGPEGVGKATLARRFAARMLGHAEKIEQDDLSLEHNREIIAEREKLASDKRADDPLLFSTHPDFLTFCPEGPLRNLSIQQMRLIKERAQFKPLSGKWRIFLIDQMDRASQQAADSLLKTLEEPPSHLILVVTAENPYDLPSTIRSRSVPIHLSPLAASEMKAFAESRQISLTDRRLALSGNCPGLAVTLDLAAYEKRRKVLLGMLEASAAETSFGNWVQASESFIASKSEKLDFSIKLLYTLLEDVLVLFSGGSTIRNVDERQALDRIARRVSFSWLQQAVRQTDQLVSLQRRNVQKGLTLDAFVVNQRMASRL